MVTECSVHGRLKARIWRALHREIAALGLPCNAMPDGTTVEIDQDTDYELAALNNCGPSIPDDAMVASSPVVVVEARSPSTASVDAGGVSAP
jgi:hypothetical protein